MQLDEMRIIFMGTPDFAVASLDALVKSGCNIIAVITAPDKPAGRGMKLTESAVKQFARSHNLPVLQPEKLKNPEFIANLKSLNAHLQVVVAFRMLPEVVWNMPPMGTVNLHGSLLPQYRGAAPIQWAVINGESTTGVTTFKLKHEIDTGEILLQKSIPIGKNETAGLLHDRMKIIGADLLVTTVKALAANNLQPTDQESILQSNNIALHHAPKIFSETARINWEYPAKKIYNLIRGLSPYPGATTLLEDKILKIYAGIPEMATPQETPGTWITDGKTFFKYACADGYIQITDLQLEGKKRMPVIDFLRGWKK